MNDLAPSAAAGQGRGCSEESEPNQGKIFVFCIGVIEEAEVGVKGVLRASLSSLNSSSFF